MATNLDRLYVQRGRLRERIGVQRSQLAQELAPLRHAADAVDGTRTLFRQTLLWLSARPMLVTSLVVALMVWRPRIVWRSLRWGFSTWRSWSGLQAWIRGRLDKM